MTRRKYANIKTEVAGIVFDSRKEARRWSDLCLLERAGEITDLGRQTRYAIDVNGVTVCHYVADFTYRDKSGSLVVEDVKSEATAKLPMFRLKAKLMKAVHGIDVVLA